MRYVRISKDHKKHKCAHFVHFSKIFKKKFSREGRTAEFWEKLNTLSLSIVWSGPDSGISIWFPIKKSYAKWVRCLFDWGHPKKARLSARFWKNWKNWKILYFFIKKCTFAQRGEKSYENFTKFQKQTAKFFKKYKKNAFFQ